MASIIYFIFFVIGGIFNLIVMALVINAVMSWLVAFNVINTRNPAVWRILDVLDRITAPILAPFRAFIPPMGGLDLSYIVAVLVIKGIQLYLLPAARDNLILLLGS